MTSSPKSWADMVDEEAERAALEVDGEYDEDNYHNSPSFTTEAKTEAKTENKIENTSDSENASEINEREIDESEMNESEMDEMNLNRSENEIEETKESAIVDILHEFAECNRAALSASKAAYDMFLADPNILCMQREILHEFAECKRAALSASKAAYDMFLADPNILCMQREICATDILVVFSWDQISPKIIAMDSNKNGEMQISDRNLNLNPKPNVWARAKNDRIRFTICGFSTLCGIVAFRALSGSVIESQTIQRTGYIVLCMYDIYHPHEIGCEFRCNDYIGKTMFVDEESIVDWCSNSDVELIKHAENPVLERLNIVWKRMKIMDVVDVRFNLTDLLSVQKFSHWDGKHWYVSNEYNAQFNKLTDENESYLSGISRRHLKKYAINYAQFTGLCRYSAFETKTSEFNSLDYAEPDFNAFHSGRLYPLPSAAVLPHEYARICCEFADDGSITKWFTCSPQFEAIFKIVKKRDLSKIDNEQFVEFMKTTNHVPNPITGYYPPPTKCYEEFATASPVGYITLLMLIANRIEAINDCNSAVHITATSVEKLGDYLVKKMLWMCDEKFWI